MSARISAATMTTLIIATTDVSGTLISDNQFIIEENRSISQNEVAYTTQTEPLIQTSEAIQSDKIYSIAHSFVIENTFKKLERELLSYSQLKPNWDYDDAIVPERSNIDSSIEFLNILKNFQLPPPKTMVSGDGEVCLYWSNKYFYIEVGFENKGLFSYIVDDYQTPFSEDDCIINNFVKSKLFSSLNNFSTLS